MEKTVLSHLNHEGEANMVDVSIKEDTYRKATAQAKIFMSRDCFEALREGNHKKGDVLATARIAGIQAAKQTAQLIPLCHPLLLTKVSVEFQLDSQSSSVSVVASCSLTGKTGVEMEALTAASIAALTIYDMCKAVDKGIVISELCLVEKQGGKSGRWSRATS